MSSCLPNQEIQAFVYGLSSKKAAKIILSAIKHKKRQIVISKWSDVAWLGVFINKFFPSLYFFLAKRINA